MTDLRDRDDVIDRWLRRAASAPAGPGPSAACLDAEVMAAWVEGGLSDAALRAVTAVGGLWRLASGLLLVPRVIRNGVYRFVARNRIRWFGRVASCELLSAEDRARLLP